MGQKFVFFIKFLDFVLFLTEGPDYPDAGEVFPGGPQEPVQGLLGFGEKRNALDHNAQHHSAKDGNGHHENQGAAHINGEGHDHGAKHHEGGPEQQAQGQVETGLDLVHVAGHPGNQGVRAQGVQLGIGQRLDVVEQGLAQAGGKAHGTFGSVPLGGKGEAHFQNGQSQHQPEAQPNVVGIAAHNAFVDDVRHHQRHQ